ncbi:MAG: hypothetical protein ACLU7D_01700 [Collinsella sp.]
MRHLTSPYIDGEMEIADINMMVAAELQRQTASGTSSAANDLFVGLCTKKAPICYV